MHTPTSQRARKWQKKQKHVQKPEPKSLSNNQIKQLFLQRMKQELAGRKRNGEPINEASIVSILKAAAETTLPKVKSCKTNEIWKDDTILNELLEARKEKDNTSDEYKYFTKNIKKRIKHLRNEKIANEAKMINGFASRRQVEELYRSFKSENSTFKDSRSTKKCDPTRMKNFFEAHFTGQPVEVDPLELTEAPEYIKKLKSLSVHDISTGPPDEKVIREVIRNLKCGKASNDVPMEYIKKSMCVPEFAEEILKLYKTIWQTRKLPRTWGHSKLVTLWKGPTKGSADDPSTYRGLQIGSSLCKIIVVIIIRRLKTWYEKQLLDQQQGFRTARGTTDGIFVAKRVQQITSKIKKPTFVLFVDLTAAFDHVERGWLFKILRSRYPENAESTLLELLESLYASTTTSLNENPENTFKLTVGVRQGGPESPLLYNLYMDFVMRVYLQECKRENVRFLKVRYKIPEYASSTNVSAAGDLTVDWSGYADDLMLFFEDEKSLRDGLKILEETFSRYRLKINPSKTKTMILNQQHEQREYPSSISALNGVKLTNVKQYTYLGCETEYIKPGIGEAELKGCSRM